MELELETELNIIVDGVEIYDASVMIWIDADVRIVNLTDLGGLTRSVVIDDIKTTYMVELPVDFCLETLGHSNNLFEIKRKQVIGKHPDLLEVLQDRYNKYY